VWGYGNCVLNVSGGEVWGYDNCVLNVSGGEVWGYDNAQKNDLIKKGVR